MARITRGSRDKSTSKIKAVLDEYDRDHPGAASELYRQNSASIRIRIIDDRFARQSKAARHDGVFNYLSDRLDEDTLQEISVLLLLSPKEEKSSFMNTEFEHPVNSIL